MIIFISHLSCKILSPGHGKRAFSNYVIPGYYIIGNFACQLVFENFRGNNLKIILFDNNHSQNLNFQPPQKV